MGTTAHYNWLLPTVGLDSNAWGGYLNTTIGAIDGVVWNIEKVELAAIQGQLNANNLTLARTASLNGGIIFNNSAAPAGQQARWIIFGADTEAESGANAGTNFLIQAYNDAGASLGPVMECVRQTGQVGFNHSVSVTGTFSTVSTASVGGALNVTGLLTANAGANISGTTTVNGSLYAGACFFGWPGVSDFLANVSGNLRYIQWEANWYDGWNASGGLRSWVAAGTTIMSLDGGGNLTLAGGCAAASYSTGGGITANGNITAGGGVTAGGNLQANGGSVIARASGSGNAQVVLENNAGAAAGYFYCDAATGNININNAPRGSSFQLLAEGDCYVTPATSGNNFVVTQGTGLKPGGGSWGSFSDARIKTVKGDYTSGLEAVLQLRPVTYVYKGDYAARSEGKEFVGLVADEAMKVLPEMVSLQAGTIDGVEVNDLKVLDTTSLIFALVNAVKELKAEIEALKASK